LTSKANKQAVYKRKQATLIEKEKERGNSQAVYTMLHLLKERAQHYIIRRPSIRVH